MLLFYNTTEDYDSSSLETPIYDCYSAFWLSQLEVDFLRTSSSSHSSRAIFSTLTGNRSQGRPRCRSTKTRRRSPTLLGKRWYLCSLFILLPLTCIICRDNKCHLSFPEDNAGQHVKASHQALLPVESANTSPDLHRDHDEYSYSNTNGYATVEHKGESSQLGLWAYEIRNDNLTVAERLEKWNWEPVRLERL